MWARLKKRGQFRKDEGLLTGFLSVISNKKKKKTWNLEVTWARYFFNSFSNGVHSLEITESKKTDSHWSILKTLYRVWNNFWRLPAFKNKQKCFFFSCSKLFSFLTFLHFCPGFLVMQKNGLIRKL